MNSRAKGKVGELEAAQWFRDHGHPARRGQQFAGGADSPDVIVGDLPHVHFEVKRTERLDLEAAMGQAIYDGRDRTPVVMHRRNRGEWLMTMRAEDALDLLTVSANAGANVARVATTAVEARSDYHNAAAAFVDGCCPECMQPRCDCMVPECEQGVAP